MLRARVLSVLTRRQAEEGSDILRFTFESPKADKISNFELKLMDIQVRQAFSLASSRCMC